MPTKPKVGVKIRLIRHFRELWYLPLGGAKKSACGKPLYSILSSGCKEINEKAHGISILSLIVWMLYIPVNNFSVMLGQ